MFNAPDRGQLGQLRRQGVPSRWRQALAAESRRRPPAARMSSAQVSALLMASDYRHSYRFYTFIERKTYRKRVEREEYWRRVLAQARTPLASLRSITSTPVAGPPCRAR